MKKYIICMAVSCFLFAGCGNKTPQLGKDPIDDVIAAMTLEEKVHLIGGIGMAGYTKGDSAVVGETLSIIPISEPTRPHYRSYAV
ncbi:MAG: hypothetical protein K2I89_01650, partial [Muribaculaceae bacterium]|nr:hypothetical protein [Muribaculaceae bacterium]